MEYISHEDYKSMMDSFKKGTPKKVLKEDLEKEGNAFTAGLAKAKKGQEFKVGDKAVKDTSNYDAPVKEYQFDDMYPEDPGPFEESHEGNDQWYDAFSDALAQLSISDKARKLVDRALNHADVTNTYSDMKPQEAAKEFVRDIVAMFKNQVKESGNGDVPFAGFYEKAIESASGDKISHTEEDDYGRTIYWGTKNPNVTYYIGDDHKIICYNGETGERYPIGNINDYDEPTHDYEPDTDADYEEPVDRNIQSDFNDGEFWENEVKKLQEIAGLREDVEFDDEDEEAKEKRAKKAEMDDEEAENAEREIDEDEEKPNMHDPETVAKVVVKKYGAELKPKFDKYQASYEQYIQDIRSGKPNQQELSKAHNAIVKDFQNDVISWAGHEMLEAGMKKVEVSNLLSGYGYFEDWLMDYVSAINKELKGVSEGLHMPPLQATGPTVITNEDQAPYGFSVLSPDEREQLKEYINSYRTIKSEISKLLEKAGKTGKIMEGVTEDEAVPAARPAHYNEPTKTPKHNPSNLGGNRTGLVMTKAEMWENEEGEHERIESMLDTKLHDAFHKVTGMIMKDLMDDGFDEGDIKLFLQHEIEEKAKEATMSQHDF